MREFIGEERFRRIVGRLTAADRIAYVADGGLFEGDASADMRSLVEELQSCWQEIEELKGIVRLLTEKVKV